VQRIARFFAEARVMRPLAWRLAGNREPGSGGFPWAQSTPSSVPMRKRGAPEMRVGARVLLPFAGVGPAW
jgi:hypothetical protein